MCRTRPAFISSLLIALFILLSTYSVIANSSELESKEIIIAADEWCPYNCSPGSKQPGYMVEIAQQAIELTAPGQYTLSYIQMPWKRAMLMAQQGEEVHGIIGAIASEAEGLHMPDEEQGLMYAKFIVKNDNPWQFINTKQLVDEDIRLGAIAGYDYEASIAKFIADNPQQVFLSTGDPALPKLIKLLRLNRIDTLIEDQAVFWYNIKSLGLDPNGFRVAGDIELPQKLYLAFHNKIIADLVSKGTVKLRQSGRLDQILQKYNLSDWK